MHGKFGITPRYPIGRVVRQVLDDHFKDPKYVVGEKASVDLELTPEARGALLELTTLQRRAVLDYTLFTAFLAALDSGELTEGDIEKHHYAGALQLAVDRSVADLEEDVIRVGGAGRTGDAKKASKARRVAREGFKALRFYLSGGFSFPRYYVLDSNVMLGFDASSRVYLLKLTPEVRAFVLSNLLTIAVNEAIENGTLVPDTSVSPKEFLAATIGTSLPYVENDLQEEA